MEFEPRRISKESVVYRALDRNGWIDKQRDPWGVKLKAFLRRPSDYDGPTVVPEPCHCFALRSVVQIAKLSVGEIDELVDPVSGENLFVWQDQADHAYIAKVPFHHEFQRQAEDLATDLASIALILSSEEYEQARQVWLARKGALEPDSGANEGRRPA